MQSFPEKNGFVKAIMKNTHLVKENARNRLPRSLNKASRFYVTKLV